MQRLRLLCLLWVALGGFAVPIAAQPGVPELAVEHYELPNGLDVILYQDHSIPIVSVNVWYHVGSKNEQPGRTGFAHLFEHMMFQGSAHHDQEYFEPLQNIGGTVNGSTNFDRTNYWEDVPSNYLELALWLEADRMGFLLPAMTQKKLDNQRDVVKNERRQRYENQPYAKSRLLLPALLYPPDHPYSWATIGSMEDLSAALLEDVKFFFKTYYVPNNASLVIAGDFNRYVAKAWVKKYFSSLPAGPSVQRPSPQPPELTEERRLVVKDNVALPRLYYAWHTPAVYTPGDAEMELLANILAQGKASRLFQALVRERHLAQGVRGVQWSQELGSTFHITVTVAKDQTVSAMEQAVDAELRTLLDEGISDLELEQAKTHIHASFIRRLQQTRHLAEQLNTYNTYLGAPNKLHWDLERFRTVTADDVRQAARRYLDPTRRVKLIIVPQGEFEDTGESFDRSVMPSPMAEPTFEPPSIQRTTLANGLEILVVEDHTLPLVQVNLVVKSGRAADPVNRPGTAELTANLLDNGTRTRRMTDIAAEVKRLGARFRTSSSYDSSTVRLNVLKQNLRDGLVLVADVVLNPTFSSHTLHDVRRHYLGRIRQEAKQPRTAAIKIFHQMLYGTNHPYGQPYTGSGTEAALSAITRDDLKQYYRTHYLPNNAAIILVGDITLDEAAQHAERLFGAWEPGTLPARAVPEAAPFTQTHVYILDKPGAAQSIVVAGNTGIRRSDPSYYAFLVLQSALGGKFQSRINLNLREDKGYTYGARTLFRTPLGVGPFAVIAAVQRQSTGVMRKNRNSVCSGSSPIGSPSNRKSCLYLHPEQRSAQPALLRGSEH